MATETRISSKGQVVIPKDIRKKLGLKPGDMVKFETLEGKRAIMQPAVEPTPDIFVKAGSKVVEETLLEANLADDKKITRLLKALGVST